MPSRLNHRNLADFGEVAPQRPARVGRELYKNPATVMGVGAANEDSLADHRLEPTQRRSRRDRRRDAQARDRHAQVRDLRLKQVEKHVPRRVGEQFFGEETRSQAARPNDRADGIGGHRGNSPLGVVSSGLGIGAGPVDSRASVAAMRLTSSLS